MGKQDVPRRTFVAAWLAAAGGSVVSTVSCMRRRASGYWRSFSDDEARIVEAICARLIPADRDPGATEARVVDFVDIQLSRHLRRSRAAYRKSIAEVEASAWRVYNKRFVDLSAEQQDAVLKDLEENSHELFDLLLNHARQGFYGDPRHGGNYRMCSWKMVGLPFPPVRGRQSYDGPKAG